MARWRDGAAAVLDPSVQPSINPVRMLALPLFVSRVGADHTDNAFAANDLAVLAKLFDRGSYFHNFTFFLCPPGSGLAINRKATMPVLLCLRAPTRETWLSPCRRRTPTGGGRWPTPRGTSGSAEFPRLNLQPGRHPFRARQNLRFGFGDEHCMLKMSG